MYFFTRNKNLLWQAWRMPALTLAVVFGVYNDGSARTITTIERTISSSDLTRRAEIVKGKVADSKGETLPGVSVKVKGTTIATTTDNNGDFTLNIEDANSTVLVFSYIGFKSQEVAVNGRTMLNVRMESESTALEQVVVVGYGVQRKVDITGSVAVVNAEELKKFATNDVAQLLQGRAAGVTVNTDGQPGANPSVRIRGFSTFGDAQPLYVIDGVPVGTTPRDFNPNDIESMQVLKDASAGAVYGSRAQMG